MLHNKPRKIGANESKLQRQGRLTLKMRKKLASAARCAIKMRSKEDDRRKAVKLLEKDLKMVHTIVSAFTMDAVLILYVG